MSSATTKRPVSLLHPSDLESFTAHLERSRRIIAVLGAGLSASSGLPTFRGAGGLWRRYDATSLATPGAFRSDPGLVWQFYSYRRHMALKARPNRAHYALAELARRRPGFVTLSQNVDGLSPRAGHPEGQLKLLHGSLFDVKCEDDEACGYIRRNDFTDPISPVLAIPQEEEREEEEEEEDDEQGGEGGGAEANSAEQSKSKPRLADPAPLLQAAVAKKSALMRGNVDISNAEVPLPAIPRSSLPHCPSCKTHLLRPGVVWFGESLPPSVLSDIDAYMDGSELDPEAKAEEEGGGAAPVKKKNDDDDDDNDNNDKKGRIDLCLVIGTSSQVYPAAGYASIARSLGARVAIVNMDGADARDLREGDWFFEGDAAEIVPEILKSVIGEMEDDSPSS